MDLKQAKIHLDKVINKGRVHFYKPFQIAEILYHHRMGEIDDLLDLESYKNSSRRWRDHVSTLLVGRNSNSSARYQDDVFNHNACPPEALKAIGNHNNLTNGEVEAYIYRMFEAKIASIKTIFLLINEKTPETFDLVQLVEAFEHKPGLKRSIDKLFEITAYALFSTLIRYLRLQINISISSTDLKLIKNFNSFLEKVVGLKDNATSLILPANLFRLGSTNAADRGVDMLANFGLAIQVKHLTLDVDAIADICDEITADRIVIVCKDSEVEIIDAVIMQLGLDTRLQGLVTFRDLQDWYQICFNPSYRDTLGTSLLADFIREFSNEFPSMDALSSFISKREYSLIQLSTNWVTSNS